MELQISPRSSCSFVFQIVLATKDEEIVDLNKIVFDLQGQLQAARMDTDKNAVAELILVSYKRL